MVLVYAHTSSPRLQYTCAFIFEELMGMDFCITIDSESYTNHEGAKINYSSQSLSFPGFSIYPAGLLFECDIKEQNIECFEINGNKAFFKTATGDYPFDIFAAVFYLLSRYEEYLPHQKDMYGRYAHENSLACKNGFLHLPLINIWIKDFVISLEKMFPTGLPVRRPAVFSFIPTYDIDIAWSYKNKGLVRNIGGFIKNPSLQRIQVLSGFKKDPFDSYNWLDAVHKKYNLSPLYFFLLADKNTLYDKNILPHKEAMWNLVKRISRKYTVGIHPSWQTGDHFYLLKKEIIQLEAMIDVTAASTRPSTIKLSRQHYIRFNLPGGYQRLSDAGITHDYSMGYGSINGFRASVASSFFWYDLEKEEQTQLHVHPFCFMEANAYYEQHFSPAQAAEELNGYVNVCKSVHGQLITIWHNNFLGTDKAFAGWKEIYIAFIEAATSVHS
jgi:hypothetical protein